MDITITISCVGSESKSDRQWVIGRDSKPCGRFQRLCLYHLVRWFNRTMFHVVTMTTVRYREWLMIRESRYEAP